MPTDTAITIAELRAGTVQVPPGRWAPLLRSLHEAGETGYLWWRDGYCSACIKISGGEVVGAQFGNEEGLGALVQCIVRSDGVWCLNDDGSVTDNIDRSTDEILEGVEKVLQSYGLAGSGAPPVVSLVDEAQSLAEGEIDEVMNSTQVFRGFHPPAIGTVLGRCQLEEELGRGATSVVYRASHKSLHIDVAVKVLLPDPNQNDEVVSLTGNEARMLAKLNHPAILRVLDFDDEGAWPYLVIEFVDGPTLSSVMKDAGRLDQATILPIAYQVASGLAHAHEGEGLIHCDLKPGNVLMTKDGQAKIADMGLARIIQRQASTIAGFETQRFRSGEAVVGTPAYIAPEIVEYGHDAADHRSDMYALGAMIYHALAGRPPYQHDDPMQLMLLHTQGGYTPIQALVPSVSNDTADMIHTLLGRHQSDRYDSYGELLGMLGSLAEGGGKRGSAGRRTSLFKQLLSKFWER